MSQREELKKGQELAEKAFWLEGSLVVAKTIVGLLSGSLVLLSDAIHSGSDILSIITSWFGLKIAQRKADERFPYGYYKAENLGALVISFLILYAFLQMITQAYEKFFSVSSIKVPILAMAVSLIDALVLFIFGKYEIKIGKKINAQSLIAMGAENKTHIFSSGAVLLGTLSAYYKIPYIESIITIIISFLILKIGLTTIKDSVFALMDVSPGKEIEKKVLKIIESVTGLEECFDLRLRKSGPFILGEVKVGIRKFVDFKRTHQIADEVERRVKRKIPQIESLLVHVEPFKSNWQHLVLPVVNKKSLRSKISSQFARAPYLLFINLKKNKPKGFYFLKNPYWKKKIKTGLAVAKLVIKQKSDILITKQIGEIAFYALKENLFDIYQTEDQSVAKSLNKFLKSKLNQLIKPTKSV